ncbi:MAG: ribosome recycling factor [Salinivirgaceae bacterium]|nr:ribosome recycling factor [Salinivirgaceae bacterium]MDD4747393.1 ribosome recycling factor [Salinivirgaceae bacterium]MDY0280349.1 ribosome recycling factor [Salinivirgaceae bacterium]
MNEELGLYLEDVKEKMDAAIDHLERVLAKIRAGRANPAILDTVMIDYYGTATQLSRISSISAPDARTIRVQPFERNMISTIEKAILIANLGFNPSNNGEAIIINVPPLTEERRRDLVKQAKNEGEVAKVSIRNARRDTNEEIKKLQKNGLSEDLAKGAEAEVQEITNKYSAKTDELLAEKEKDIMTI